jgi:hypothetical protein
MFTLAAAMAADHPIIISGGSPLVIQHDGWDTPDDHTLVSRFPSNTVTSIVVTSADGKSQTFQFNQEQCELSLTYGATSVDLTTNPRGRALRLKLDDRSFFSKHFRRKDSRTFESLRSDAAIQGLKIVKAGTEQPVGPLSGHVEIVVHYE